MTTKLLVQIHEQDQQALADRYNGEDVRQPRRVWVVKAICDKMTSQEGAAAEQAVRECSLLFSGAIRESGMVIGSGFQIWRDESTKMLTSSSEQKELRMTAAMSKLNALKDGVARRTDADRAPECVERIVRLETAQDVAAGMGWWRKMGPGRDPIPDLRPLRPFVRCVLLAMAGYYADERADVDLWDGLGRA